ncbi:MAG: alpha/beta hydrolase [Elainellaceae cyanobacterium]
MLQFHPPGIGQQTFTTSLGVVAYYTPKHEPWTAQPSQNSSGASTPSGRVPLLFLHSLGGGSSAYEWSKVYPAFALSHEVIAPDLIGWGQSTHPERDYRCEDYLQNITEILEAIDEIYGQPAAIVATSLTGGLSIRVAIARPELVRSLFLVSPSGYGDFGVDYRRGLGAQLAATPFIDRLLYAVGAANELAIRNFLQQFLFAKASRITDEMVQAYLASALQPNADYSALASLKGDIFFDLALYMEQLTVPTHFIWGTNTRFNTPKLGRRLAALNGDAVQQFTEIPDVGILPHLEQPAVIIGILQAWLNQAQTNASG